MQTFAQSLIDLVLRGEVEREIAANAATNRHDFLVALEAAEKVKAEEDQEAGRAAAAAGNGDAAPGFAPIGNSIR